MAKANLTIDPAFIEAFTHACTHTGSVPIDYFTLKVDGTTVVLLGSGAVGDDRTAVFPILSSQASEVLAAAAAAPPLVTGAAARPEARIWVVRAPPVTAGVTDALVDAWLVVGFTPEGVHPRSKMLAAAARDDIRRVAGVEHFVVGDFFGTEPTEIDASAFAAWRSRDANDAMSKREIAVREVDRVIAVERASLGGTAPPMRMALAPASFSFDASLTKAIASYPNAPESGFIEIRVTGDTLSAVTSGSERAANILSDLIAKQTIDEPRFWLLRPNCQEGVVSDEAAPPLLLVYHCPELAKPKQRMAYSTAKAQLIKALDETGGAAVTRTVSSPCLHLLSFFYIPPFFFPSLGP